MTPSLINADAYRAASLFGISGGYFHEIPSFSHRVVRVETTTQTFYLKEYPGSMERRVRATAWLAESVAEAGIPAPRFRRTSEGDLCVAVNNKLFTLSHSITEKTLLQLTEPSFESIPLFLANLQTTLATVANDEAVPPPDMWNSFDLASRIDDALAQLRKSSGSRAEEFVTSLEYLGELVQARVPLHALKTAFGVVHGDFWPGNIVRADRLELGILDFDDSLYGPVLLDVAQFVDLAYAVFDGRIKKGIRLGDAARFARSYAKQTQLPVEVLSSLPEVLIAARVCSALWIVEQHLIRGPTSLDTLLVNDIRTLRFGTARTHEWRETLTTQARAV